MTKAARKYPLIRLSKKQYQKLGSELKGMTLAGAMALAVKDEGKFQAIYDRQQEILHALSVLGISIEIDEK